MKFLTFQDEKNKIKIKYHPHWNIIKSRGSLVAFLSPLMNPEDKYRENLNVVVEKMDTQVISLDDYVKLSMIKLREGFKNFKLISTDPSCKIAKNKAYKIIYEGIKGSFHLKFIQFFLFKENRVFIITYTSEYDKYNDFLEVIEKMIKSCKIV